VFGGQIEITWITGRDLEKDLAKTTELGFFNALTEMGHVVNVYSTTKLIRDSRYNHKYFKKIRIKGFETLSGSFYLKRKLVRDKNLYNSDCILIDWRYVVNLSEMIHKTGIPWYIIDRGPPVYDSILTKIQKKMWEKSWKIANEKSQGGFVVSKNHKKLVEKIGINIPIKPLSAGINNSEYKNLRDKDIKDKIDIIYAGRLDKNRGMENLIKFSRKISKISIPSKMHIMGEGDYSKKIRRVAKNNQYLEFHGKLNSNEVRKIMKKSHFGVMPMPKSEIWPTSSPIKLHEYIASGMLIIGDRHIGNMLEETDGRWSLLVIGDEWVNKSIGKIEDIIRKEDFSSLSKIASSLSKEFDWENIATELIRFIEFEY